MNVFHFPTYIYGRIHKHVRQDSDIDLKLWGIQTKTFMTNHGRQVFPRNIKWRHSAVTRYPYCLSDIWEMFRIFERVEKATMHIMRSASHIHFFVWPLTTHAHFSLFIRRYRVPTWTSDSPLDEVNHFKFWRIVGDTRQNQSHSSGTPGSSTCLVYITLTRDYCFVIKLQTNGNIWNRNCS